MGDSGTGDRWGEGHDGQVPRRSQKHRAVRDTGGTRAADRPWYDRLASRPREEQRLGGLDWANPPPPPEQGSPPSSGPPGGDRIRGRPDGGAGLGATAIESDLLAWDARRTDPRGTPAQDPGPGADGGRRGDGGRRDWRRLIPGVGAKAAAGGPTDTKAPAGTKAPVGEADGDPDGGARTRRRALVGGALGTGLATTLAYVAKGMPGLRTGAADPPPPPRNRGANTRPSDAGGFGSRDESYASSGSAAPPEAPPGPTMLFASATEAAANTEVTTPTILATDRPALHLLRRMTFGPTPDLVSEVQAKGIDAWLDEQLQPMAIDDPVADQAWAAFPMASMSPAQIQGALEHGKWDAMLQYGQATLARQIWSRRQLYEVMVDFWANHLNVTMPSHRAWDVGIAYHNEVIRGHALGSFTDLLLAAGRHPGMLRYLDNDKSAKENVNENLGRELLELHTVGVGSGYTEEDVRNSAYILSGRTTTGEDDPRGEAVFFYDPARHWTGPVRVLDFQHDNATPEGGLEVGDAYLRYLASHPATAQTIAHKLAVRFVSDAPPPSLVERLATTYLESGTEIAPVLDVLLRSREFWAAVGQKTRRPLENLVASARILGVQPGPDTRAAIEKFVWAANDMGHQPLAWKAPNGYPDVYAAWRSASGLLHTWNRHRALVEGWDDGATYVPPDQLVVGMPSATVGEYVDSMCQRLCFQNFPPEHRQILFLLIGAAPEVPVAESPLPDAAGLLAKMVLDSPYFALR